MKRAAKGLSAFFVITVLVLLAAFSNAEAAPSKATAVWYQGLHRSYLLHLPKDFPAGRAFPLVIVLHASGETGAVAERMSGMSRKADEEGFIAVYPDGTGDSAYDLSWNAGNCCEPAVGSGIDDAGFIGALIDGLETQYPIDRSRVYLTGFSNGASLLYEIACRFSDKVAAIAPVSGSMEVPYCASRTPVSVLIFHGTEDINVNYNGGIAERATYGRTDTSVFDAFSFWKERDGCGGDPVASRNGDVLLTSQSGCSDGSAVALYTLVGEGHEWPGGREGAYFGSVDTPTQAISATDVMWDFFKNHPKKKRVKGDSV